MIETIENTIDIKCNVSEGLFSNEYAVEIITKSNIISLYVNKDFVFKNDNEYYISARKVNENYVILPGEKIDLRSTFVDISTIEIKERI